MARKKRRKRTKAQPAGLSEPAPSAFQTATEAHRSGRLEAAAAAYEAVLAADPDHTEARHLQGVVAIQQRDFPAALTLLDTAISMNDAVPAYHDHRGLALRLAGRAGEAEAEHRKALELDPTFAAAHNNLGGTLLALGRLEEAEQAVRHALELQPGDPEAVLNLANVMLARGRPAGAAGALEAVHKVRPATAETVTQLAVAYHRAGRRADSEAMMATAVDLGGSDPGILASIATLHMEAEDFDAAAGMFAQALSLDPSAPGLASNHGVALWRAGRLDEAEDVFSAHLENEPTDIGALLGLAAVASARGHTGFAWALYYRALDLDPDNLDALNNLATEGGGEISDANAERVAGIFGATATPDGERAKAGFALAAYLRHCDEHDAAFDVAATANECRAAAMARNGSVFDPIAHDAHVAARLRVFNADFFAARRDCGSADETPVFVVGMPRSGTTLVEQILASHSEVHGAGERRDMAELALVGIPARLDEPSAYPDCLRQVDPDVCAWAADRYVGALRGADRDAKRVVDKMPFNFMHLGLISLLFPRARVIHCRRDMRDVALSCFFTNFADSHPWSTRFQDIVRFVQAYRRVMAHWRRVLPLEILELDYESLVADQEAESRRMVTHLGLTWDDACLNFHETPRTVSTAARAQVRQPLYTGAVGRWRAYERWMMPFNAALVGAVDEV